MNTEQLKNNLVQYAEEHNFPIEFIGEEIHTVIIGEYHSKFYAEQLDLIRLLKPRALLHEGFTCFEYYPATDILNPKPNRPISPDEIMTWHAMLRGDIECDLNDFQHFLEISKELQMPIIGCDLSMAELLERAVLQSPDRDKLMEIAFQNPEKLPPILDAGNLEERDDHMFGVISEYHKAGKTPTLAIIGIFHALDINLTRKEFSNYCYIEQIREGTRNESYRKYVERKYAKLVSLGIINPEPQNQ